jgi:predicted O-linked N-acetylglucosamine transferase (SPINDLY family)
MPEVDAPITFGSFNLALKISDPAVALWSRVMAQVPGSRLLVKSAGLADTAPREALLSRFAAHGVDASRIELLGQTPTRADHLRAYSRVHVALDTFPYNGTTTTCEALWMGVPVIATVGNRHAARVSASLLHAAGLDAWVAKDADDFVRIAVQLATDRAALSQWRASLRDRLRASPLLDAKAYAQQLHAALRACCTGAR